MGQNQENKGTSDKIKIILIQTRYFDKIKEICNELTENPINELLTGVFEHLIIKKNFVKYGNDDFQANGINTTEKFVGALRDYYKGDSEKSIDNNFNGFLFRLTPQINEEKHPINVFFYHHWFDKQFSNVGLNPTNYLQYILEKIYEIVNISGDVSWYLFLHDGDFNDDNEYSNLEVDKVQITKSVYRFSHSSGHFVWDLLLNNDKIVNEIQVAIGNGLNIEDWILSRLVPEKIDEEFNAFLKK